MTQKQNNNEDKLLIETLLAQLNSMMGWSYKTDHYPDVVNRKSKDIDLIAKSTGLPDLAFEETRITSFENQVGFEEKIKKIYLSKESYYKNKIKSGVICFIPLNIFSEDEGDYNETSELILKHLVSIQDNLSIGSQIIRIPHLNLEIQILYKENSPHQFKFNIPIDENQLHISLQKALQHKKEKLQWYENHDYESALVISNYDFQNISVVTVYQEFLSLTKKGFSQHLKYVFYKDCFEAWFCFKGKNIIKNGFNPVEL